MSVLHELEHVRKCRCIILRLLLPGFLHAHACFDILADGDDARKQWQGHICCKCTVATDRGAVWELFGEQSVPGHLRFDLEVLDDNLPFPERAARKVVRSNKLILDFAVIFELSIPLSF